MSNPLVINSYMLRPKCRQPYVHNGNDCDDSNLLPPSPSLPLLPPQPQPLSPNQNQPYSPNINQPKHQHHRPYHNNHNYDNNGTNGGSNRAPRTTAAIAAITTSTSSIPNPADSSIPVDDDQVLHREMEKHHQLSDWYYIKSKPKSPHWPPRPVDKRLPPNNAKYSPALRQRDNIIRNHSSSNIFNSLNNNNNNMHGGHYDSLNRHNAIKKSIGRDDDPSHATNQLSKFGGGKLSGSVNTCVNSECTSPTIIQSLDRAKRRDHREQSPIYQHIVLPTSPRMQQIQKHAPSPAERKLPDYENHQVVSNFLLLQQQQQQQLTDASQMQRTSMGTIECMNNEAVQAIRPPQFGGYELSTCGSYSQINVPTSMPDVTTATTSTIDKHYRNIRNVINQNDTDIEGRTSRLVPIPPRKRKLPSISHDPSPNQTVSTSIRTYDIYLHKPKLKILKMLSNSPLYYHYYHS